MTSLANTIHESCFDANDQINNINHFDNGTYQKTTKSDNLNFNFTSNSDA